MAKKNKVNIGSVSARDDNSFYIKLNQDVNLKAGEYLNLENEAVQLKAIEYALSQGWIDEEKAAHQREQVSNYWNTPVKTRDGKDFIRSKSIKYHVFLSR